LSKELFSEPHRGVMTSQQFTEEEAQKLWTVLREKMLTELRSEKNSIEV
jgi:hypothetical protein